MSGRAAVVLAAAIALAAHAPTPADAALLGGAVYHVNRGIDRAIIVGANDVRYRVPKGVHSDDVVPDEDVDSIYVRAGEQVWCQAELGWWFKWADSTGYHTVGDLFFRNCYLRRDS